MAVGMGIIPSKVDADLRGTDIFEVSVEEGGTTEHSEWIGFDTADCSEGEERVRWIEKAWLTIKDLVGRASEGNTVGDGIVDVDRVLFEVDVILGREVVWEKVKCGCG